MSLSNQSKYLLALTVLAFSSLCCSTSAQPEGSSAVEALAAAGVPVVQQIASDPYTVEAGQHKTVSEPGTFAFGNTIVSAYQLGRFGPGGGAVDLGWATSKDGGISWTHGTLPAASQLTGGTYPRITDPTVGYDAKHKVWLVASNGYDLATPGLGSAILVSRSSEGTAWSRPIAVFADPTTSNLDKDWVACDNHPSSPFYGHCYAAWDNATDGLDSMSVSTDGGLTWSAPVATADQTKGLGVQPLVQPNGTVIVTVWDFRINSVVAFRSTDGGTTWSGSVVVSDIQLHNVSGVAGARFPLPGSAISNTGKVYTFWEDCRFEQGCSANDLVLSTSEDGVAWTAPARIPLDAVGSGVDHFIPGPAADPASAGHLAVTYYFLPNASCTPDTCQLQAGLATSSDGGQHWLKATLGGPMSLNWFAQTPDGAFFGDYVSTAFSSNGSVIPTFVAAVAPHHGLFDQALYSVAIAPAASTGGSALDTSARPATSSPPAPALKLLLH